MYYSMRLLGLLALQVALAHCFSWDIVMGIEKRLEFYYNGVITHTEDIPMARDIKSTTYDAVHNRVIFADNKYPANLSISSFDLSTMKTQHLVTGITTERTGDSVRVAYDPVTQLLFWKSEYNIYSFPLNPASSNKAVVGNHIVTTNMYCLDIAVDSCGRYIYWITDDEVERARFDGSEREILIEKHVFWRLSLAIDQQTQKMYWIEKISAHPGYQLSIESADLDGELGTTVYVIKNETDAKSLAVSNDFIYWRGDDRKAIWQLPKNPISQSVEAKLFSTYHSGSCFDCQHIATYYTIKEQTQGNQDCEHLKSLIPNYSVPDSTDVSGVCFHGTKVSGETRCECTQGYTGENCEVSICQNYCIQGDCSVNAEGQPECRCNPGFSGQRRVNVCFNSCLKNGGGSEAVEEFSFISTITVKYYSVEQL